MSDAYIRSLENRLFAAREQRDTLRSALQDALRTLEDTNRIRPYGDEGYASLVRVRAALAKAGV